MSSRVSASESTVSCTSVASEAMVVSWSCRDSFPGPKALHLDFAALWLGLKLSEARVPFAGIKGVINCFALVDAVEGPRRRRPSASRGPVTQEERTNRVAMWSPSESAACEEQTLP